MQKIIKVTPPATEPVTLDEAKAQLRLTAGFTADDTYIQSLISVARDRVENYCNRFFATQTVRLVYDGGFGSIDIYVPLPDVISIESITYVDSSDNENTINSANYSFDSDRQLIVSSVAWPADAQSFKVELIAGAPSEFEGAKQAMLMILTDLYELRTETVVGASLADNPAVKAMLYPYRVSLGI